MENTRKFIDGMFISKAGEKRPDFIKAEITLYPEQLVPFLKANATQNTAGKWQVRIDVKQSKEGKLYAELNDWKPESKGFDKTFAEIKKEVGGRDVDIVVDQIPF